MRIKSKRMKYGRGACSAWGDIRNAYKCVVGNPDGNEEIQRC
jgi:hypothetical protein